MDREAEYHSEITKLNHYSYRRNARAITAVWAIFTICFAVLNAIAFIQPQWIGDTENSPGVGFFGVYEYCERLQVGGEYSCRGDFLDFRTILNDSFRASSMLVGICNLLFIFAAVCLLLFCFIKAGTTLKVCGWLQFFGGLCMAAGCIVYPNGWGDERVKLVCGNDAGKYMIGRCEIRWAYILSIVLIFDAFILSFLAFMLAAKQANMLPKPDYEKEKSGKINGGFSPQLSYTAEKRPFDQSPEDSAFIISAVEPRTSWSEPQEESYPDPPIETFPDPPSDVAYTNPTFTTFSAPEETVPQEDPVATASFDDEDDNDDDDDDDDGNSASAFDMEGIQTATEDVDIRL